MSERTSTSLKRISWLRRVLQADLPEGVFQIDYSSRSLSNERIIVNGQVAIEKRISSWFSPVFRFFLGPRPAVIAVRVSPWLTVRSFHLLIDGRVHYCDSRRELFEDNEPIRAVHGEPILLASSLDEPTDPLCPYCDRPVRGIRQDFSPLPAEWRREDGPIGRPTEIFTFARGRRLALIVAGIGATLLGIALLVVLGLMAIGIIGAGMQGAHELQFLGILLLGVGPVAIWYALRNRRLYAVAGSKGIGLIENDTESVCRWEDVETVLETFAPAGTHTSMQASVRGEDHLFQVRRRDGTVLTFRNFLDDLIWLGKIIQHETLPYLLPPAVAALKNGEVLEFGPLSLDAEGLTTGPKKRLSWEDVSEVKKIKGLLMVMQTGKRWAWFKAPLSQIPNAHLLLILTRSCCKIAAQPEGP